MVYLKLSKIHLLNDPNNWNQIDTNSNVIKIINGSKIIFLYKNESETNYKVSEDLSNISSILISANNLNDITYSNNKFLFVYDNSVVTSVNGIDTLEIYYDNSQQTKFKSACYDDQNNIWIADSINGLIKITNGSIESTILPNGPASNNIFDLNFSNSKLYMSHGGHSNYNVNNLNYQGVSVYLKIIHGQIIHHNFLETVEILFQVQLMVITNILHHGMMGFQKY